MSSVAYPAQPTGPGWWRTVWLVALGWLTAGLVLAVLYLVGLFVGAIGRNTDGTPGIHAINDWPFRANGHWSLVADASVFALALIVTTAAIAWQLRRDFATVAENRLFVVLLFTGGAPYVMSDRSAPLLFLIAVWAVRAWVVKDELRVPRQALAVIGAVLVLTIASYGVTHPVWIEASAATTVRKTPTAMFWLHNQGRVPIEVDRVAVFGREARAGWPWESGRQLPVRIPPGQSRAFALKMSAGDCGGLDGTIRYRMFGRTWGEPLRASPSGFPACS